VDKGAAPEVMRRAGMNEGVAFGGRRSAGPEVGLLASFELGISALPVPQPSTVNPQPLPAYMGGWVGGIATRIPGSHHAHAARTERGRHNAESPAKVAQSHPKATCSQKEQRKCLNCRGLRGNTSHKCRNHRGLCDPHRAHAGVCPGHHRGIAVGTPGVVAGAKAECRIKNAEGGADEGARREQAPSEPKPPQATHKPPASQPQATPMRPSCVPQATRGPLPGWRAHRLRTPQLPADRKPISGFLDPAQGG